MREARTIVPTARYHREASEAYALQPGGPEVFQLPNGRRRLLCIATDAAFEEVDPRTGRVVALTIVEQPDRVAA